MGRVRKKVPARGKAKAKKTPARTPAKAKDLKLGPHVVYPDGTCPHAPCGKKMQAIDFHLEAFAPDVHKPLVRAWRDDAGFAGRCPACEGWIHFSLREKRALSQKEASRQVRLPDDWHVVALLL